MHLRFIRLALLAGCSLLLVHPATAIDPMPDNTPGVTPTPTVAPVPTAPPVSPPPTPAISPSPISTPPPIPSPTAVITPPLPTPPPIRNTPTPPPTPTVPPSGTPLPYEPPVNTPSPPPTPDPVTIIDPEPIVTPTPPNTIVAVDPPAANPEEVIPVVITYGEGPETRAAITQGLMLPVGVPPQKSVTVSLLLPSAYAGQVVTLALYDGGRLGPAVLPGSEMIVFTNPTVAKLFASADGTVDFNFQAGALLGLYRVAAAIGPNRYLLQFYAVKPRPNPLGNSTHIHTPTPSPTVPIPTPNPPPNG